MGIIDFEKRIKMNLNENQQKIIDKKLNELSKSKFRSSFKLTKKDKEYIKEKGMNTILRHTYDIIEKRLKPKDIPNDGKQTPFRNHPTFKAQHATACCCRGCLEKWHHIEANRELTSNEVNYIVSIIIEWINRQL